MPGLMLAFWRRATAPGVLAAMLTGTGVVLALFTAGWLLSWMGHDPGIGQRTAFRPYYLLGIDPVVWGLGASIAAGAGVSLWTKPPAAARVAWFFDQGT